MKEKLYVSDFTYSSLATTVCLQTILGSLLNGFTLATFIKHHKLLTVPNIIIFSMMLSDLITSSIASPLIIHANIMETWPFGDSGCKAYGFLVTLCGLASLNHLAGAAFERYDTMERATRGIGFFNEKRAVYFVVFLWLYSLMFSVFPLVNWSSYTLEGVGTSCSVDWSSPTTSAVSYTVVLFLFSFALPLGIIVFSYYKVYKVVQQMCINANNIWGSSSTAASDTLKAEKKMACLMIAMTAAFLISWTPYAVVALISATGNSYLISPLGASIPAYIAKSSCIYNPIIYVFVFKTFRKKVMAFLLGYCKRFRSENRVVPKLTYRKVIDSKNTAFNEVVANAITAVLFTRLLSAADLENGGKTDKPVDFESLSLD